MFKPFQFCVRIIFRPLAFVIGYLRLVLFQVSFSNIFTADIFFLYGALTVQTSFPQRSTDSTIAAPILLLILIETYTSYQIELRHPMIFRFWHVLEFISPCLTPLCPRFILAIWSLQPLSSCSFSIFLNFCCSRWFIPHCLRHSHVFQLH